jgi:outer membrane protein TolC
VGTVSAVRKAYTGALVAAEYERLTREILKNAEENFRNVRSLASAGITSEYDLLRAEVALENTKPEVLEAGKNARLALNGLRQVMGLSGEEEIAVADSLAYELVPDAALEGSVDSVLRVNPGLRAARLQVEVADALVGVQRSEFLPSLAAFGSYQWQAQRNQWGISTQDFIASAQVGLTLSMNVFSGLQTNARVEQAQVEMRQAAEQAAALELALRTQAEAVVLRLQTARERLQAQDRTVEQARRGYRIATTRFTSGSGTQLEVNDAQVALTRASVNRIQAVYEYIAASAEYDELLGRMPDYAMNGSDE